MTRDHEGHHILIKSVFQEDIIILNFYASENIIIIHETKTSRPARRNR